MQIGFFNLYLNTYIIFQSDDDSTTPWIYWVDFESEDGGHNGIYRARPDGSEMTHVIKDGIGKSGLRGIGKKENSCPLFFIHHTYLVHLV